MTPIISIIVPVYKVEKYLKYSLDSIVQQDTSNIEVILVDDGSPDNSGEICDNYAREYDFIKVIHKKNEGVSVARNTGIENANGKYIMFLDSDDLLTCGILKTVKEKIKNADSDIYTFSFEMIDEDGIKIEKTRISLDDKKYDKRSFLENYYDKYRNLPWNVWQSVFRTDLIKEKNVLFPTGIKVAEDTQFYIEYMKHVEKIQFSNEPIIQYRINRQGSAMSSIKPENVLNIFEIYSRYYYGDDKFLSMCFAELYVVSLLHLGKIQDLEAKEKLIDKIDVNVIKGARSLKCKLFWISCILLGKKNAVNILLKIKKH